MGVTLCNDTDIAKRLGVDSLTETQSAAWPGKAEEATVLVEGFTHRTWTALADVPKAVRIVVSRMTVRAMESPSGIPAAPIDGQTSASSTFGPMSHSRGFGADAVFTTPWLSKTDRVALAPYVARAAVYHEPMYDTTVRSRDGYDWLETPLGWSSP